MKGGGIRGWEGDGEGRWGREGGRIRGWEGEGGRERVGGREEGGRMRNDCGYIVTIGI